MTGVLTPERLKAAFETVGAYMVERRRLGEIAVYGGAAIMLQFDWRRSTEDVDAVVTSGDSGLLRDAVAYAAVAHSLPDDWLNDAVGAYTPEDEEPSFFEAAGDFPSGSCEKGLRVFVATPRYLCAMKIAALSRGERRDFDDVVNLAREADVRDEGSLLGLYGAFFPDERLGRIAAERLPAVAAEAATEPGTGP